MEETNNSLQSVTKRRENVYAKVAGLTLRGLLSKVDSLGTAERMSLDSEIDLARVLVMRAVETFNLVADADIASDGKVVASQETKLAAERHLKQALETVVDIVHTAAKTKVLDEGTMQISTVNWIVSEIAIVLEAELRPFNPNMADRILEKIANIKLPKDANIGQYINRVKDEAFL